MSKRSRARKGERTITVITDGQEPFKTYIDFKHPVSVLAIAMPDTPEITQARAVMDAAMRKLDELTDKQREKVLDEFGLFEDDGFTITMENGKEIYCSGNIKEPDPSMIINDRDKPYYKALARFLMDDE